MRKRTDGVSLIAIYHALMSLPFLIGSFFIFFALMAVFFGTASEGDFAGMIWGSFGVGIALFFVLVFAIVFLLVAWGLWNLKQWARIVAVILAIILLPGFPVFTIISAAVIWYLFQGEAKEAFDAG